MKNNIDFEIFKLLPIFIPKVLVATICGAIIGYERELKSKVAGIRTNILICVGCTLYTAISFYISSMTPNSDPTRIIAQIVTGIGFIGAGVIMKNEDKIVGVTTASFIWVVSSIGVLAGIGSIITPIIITIGLVFVSKIFERVEKKIKNKRNALRD